ncbi:MULTISPECIES: hypothetical protein [Marinobacter]|uniref:hypothetical protein n=1 Tax=Marinobacter TaxID=2742 RepID=UPI001D072220|nr:MULTISPECIES: hypothetical protein [Marinobacter]MCG8518784.1 hypothetical protein [Pseudomonadales bacterium]MCK7565953.1 hypothetical protein [Marinobacter xestospongiae]UDL06870.1 hypothetical protein J2887_09080 [Marinobacter sp. CA1]
MTKPSLAFRPAVLALSALFGLTLATGAAADQVVVPVMNQADRAQAELPRTGQSQADVRSRLGDPRQVRGPVGNPPISQWHYPTMVIYFEGDHVIHAVLKPKSK